MELLRIKQEKKEARRLLKKQREQNSQKKRKRLDKCNDWLLKQEGSFVSQGDLIKSDDDECLQDPFDDNAFDSCMAPDAFKTNSDSDKINVKAESSECKKKVSDESFLNKIERDVEHKVQELRIKKEQDILKVQAEINQKSDSNVFLIHRYSK